MKLKTHCAMSVDRTGFDFNSLHQWIDKSQKQKGVNHRNQRHHFNIKDKETIKKFWDKKKGKGWGEKALQEWLFHIALDNLNTAFKLQNKKK